MKILLRPYTHDRTRWHVDIRLMHPTIDKEIRKRMVAPAGLSEAQARTWGERQVPALLGKVLGAVDEKEAASTTTTSTRNLRLVAPPRAAMSLAAFYRERFEPEYVCLQKPATRVGYETVFRNHIAPSLGELPLVAIDEDRLSSFRAELRQRLGVSTSNLVLAKVAKMLRVAKRLRLIEVVPDVEKFSTERARPKAVLSDEAIAALIKAAGDIDTTSELIVLLALDAGLRSSEICALEWADIDLKAGSITIQNNTYRGKKQTPKGMIGKVALTAALQAALEEHRRREPIGPLVLYRRSLRTHGEWLPHTPHTIRHYLGEAQHKAGLPRTGPHLLRHTALTRLANLGASVYVVQAVARHSRLQTTQTYLHTQQVGLAREAADLLDQAASRGSGKVQAKRAKARQK